MAEADVGHEGYPTGAARGSRRGKGRYDLIPPDALARIALHYEKGARQYGERNWELGMPLGRFLDSALRHTFQALEGRTDEDHAAAAVWNLLAYMATEERIRYGELPLSLDDLGFLHGEADG